MFVYATYFSVKENGVVVKKAVYIALGGTMEGEKEILGFYIGDSESVKYWMSVLNKFIKFVPFSYFRFVFNIRVITLNFYS